MFLILSTLNRRQYNENNMATYIIYNNIDKIESSHTTRSKINKFAFSFLI